MKAHALSLTPAAAYRKIIVDNGFDIFKLIKLMSCQVVGCRGSSVNARGWERTAGWSLLLEVFKTSHTYTQNQSLSLPPNHCMQTGSTPAPGPLWSQTEGPAFCIAVPVCVGHARKAGDEALKDN